MNKLFYREHVVSAFLRELWIVIKNIELNVDLDLMNNLIYCLNEIICKLRCNMRLLSLFYAVLKGKMSYYVGVLYDEETLNLSEDLVDTLVNILYNDIRDNISVSEFYSYLNNVGFYKKHDESIECEQENWADYDVNDIYSFLYSVIEKVYSNFQPVEDSTLCSINSHDLSCKYVDRDKNLKIYYITDIHITGQDVHLKPGDKLKYKDVSLNVNNIVSNLSGDILLIGGDISRDFEKFEEFIKILYYTLLDNVDKLPLVIFVLGNHELLMNKNVPTNEEFEQSIYLRGYDTSALKEKTGKERILYIYRRVCDYYNIKLLHNDLLYITGSSSFGNYTDRHCVETRYKTEIIYQDEIGKLSIDEIKDRIYSSSENVIFFGSMGFYGYNVWDKDWKSETKKLEDIYAKVAEATKEFSLVTLFHTPVDYNLEWFNNLDTRNKIFVFGHTHHNIFYVESDDLRVYSDNQMGYTHNCALKFIDVKRYNYIFDDLKDGIYTITCDEYQRFYRCLGLYCCISEDKVNRLFMLKRKGYYMFLHETKNKSLTVLNGGQRKRLKNIKTFDLKYYYDNMEYVGATIEDAISNYTELQKYIAGFIQKFGGDGSIHGCIIDIDFYNHVYINPYDLKITYYNAKDMRDKTYYDSLLGLLKSNNVLLYTRYLEAYKYDIIKNDKILNSIDRGIYYEDTSMYTLSMYLARVQKIRYKIITDWVYDDVDINNLMNKFEPNPEAVGVSDNINNIKRLLRGEN